jgi:3-hydroxyisobutyrate dehydrogenase
MNARDPVAVIGLGAMGFPIARCLLAAGFPLTVYNRTTGRADALVAAGAALAGSPAEAAERARVVISMVSDEPRPRPPAGVRITPVLPSNVR